jgi:lysosomal acid lipase/cholesteryl ester hydrolase
VFVYQLELITGAGYDAQSHSVTTDDGYILSLQRIQHKTATPGNRPVVFLQHGLGDAAATWIVNGKQSLSMNVLFVN